MQRVLLIDDDPMFRSLVESRLPRQGDFEMIVAPCPESGLEAARERKPDVILLDLVMPPFTRESTLALIPELSRYAPVIVVSGWHSVADAVQYGAVAVVQKNLDFSFQNLAAVIRGRLPIAAPDDLPDPRGTVF
jgi:DNA-binding NarL/FixJ family response regulator